MVLRLPADIQTRSNAYCQVALCGPSRNSMMSGLYTLEDLLRNVHPDAVTMSQHFSNNGYVAARGGKDADDLQALAPLTNTWHRDGLDTPLLITPHEFDRSLDAFPLEYQAMLDRHVIIAGESPFTGARPSDVDLRRACEVQAKAFLIHLRQGWLQASDHAHDREHLLSDSAAPLRSAG